MIRFAMVADGERLIYDSFLLYCSIKYQMPDAHIIIGIPADNEKSLAIFDNTDVEKIDLPIPEMIKDDGGKYRFSNKVRLISLLGNEPAFLCDSDMLMIKPLPMKYFKTMEMAAAPDDRLSWNGDWEMVYNMFNVPLPKHRVLTTITKELSFPYYNSGFVYTSNPKLFGEKWFEITSEIVKSNIPRKYPFADQIALPVAAAAVNLEIHRLDDCFNHSMVKPFHKHSYMIHHHGLYNELKNKQLVYLRTLAKQFKYFPRALDILSRIHQKPRTELRPPMKGRDDLL